MVEPEFQVLCISSQMESLELKNPESHSMEEGKGPDLKEHKQKNLCMHKLNLSGERHVIIEVWAN